MLHNSNDTASAELGVRITLTLPALLASMAISMPNAALPLFAETFSAPFTHVQWLIQGYLLAITLLVVLVGRLGDVLGHRRLLSYGLVLYASAAFLASLSGELLHLIIYRVLQGMGGAVMLVLSMAALSLYTPANKTGKAMGLLASMSALGMAAGPALGGVLVEWFGWQAIFVGMGLLACLVYVMVLLFVSERERSTEGSLSWQKLDGTGFVWLLFALLAFSLGINLDVSLPLTLGSLAISVLCGWSFYRTERKAKYPLLAHALLSKPVVIAGVVNNFVVMMIMMTTLLVGPFYLAYALGLSELQLGFVMTAGPATVFISSFVAGYWIDRFGAVRIRITGQALLIVGCFGLSQTDLELAVLGYILPLMITTLGYSLFQTANNTETLLAIGVGEKGVLSGLLGLTRNLGLVVGASVMGTIFVWRSGGPLSGSHTLSAFNVQQGLNDVFFFAVLLLCISFFLSGWMKNRLLSVADQVVN